MIIPMKTSAAGRKFIEEWEESGKPKLKPYDDGTGTLTIGYGHTTAAGPPKVTPSLRITAEEADQILTSDLERVEKSIMDLVDVALTQNEFDALVSWQFNTGALGRSTLLKKLNQARYDEIPAELLKWDHAGGHVMEGLSRRRRAEAALWVKPDDKIVLRPSPPEPAKPAKASTIEKPVPQPTVSWWQRTLGWLSGRFSP